MAALLRDPARAEQRNYDLIVVGGGIYGAMLCLEAGFRGVRSLLLERDDFGGATSYNSLRIVHGGFRYLQNLDLRRFYESVGERQWFLQTFPELVKPLPCLMPLYDRGVKRLPVLATALMANDLLSMRRNQGVRTDRHLAAGKVLDTGQVKALFPQVDTAGLKGGALWYDASMPDSQRLVISVLRWASDLGSTALNYVTAEKLLSAEGRVVGVCGRDKLSGQLYEYRAPNVVNAAGPWSCAVASQLDRQFNNPTEIFRPSLAWNVLFNRPALSDHALAVSPKQPNAQTYFLHPWKGRLLAGTVHNPWNESADVRPYPSEPQIKDFIENLNQAIPELALERTEIVHVLVGVLPVKQAGSAKLCSQEVIVDHAAQGGVQGLYSIAGVKFTTARLVADRTLSQIFPTTCRKSSEYRAPVASIEQGQFDYGWWPEAADTSWLQPLKEIVKAEAVMHLDDLVRRRTSLGDNPQRALACAPALNRIVGDWLGWDEQRRTAELALLSEALSA